MGIFSKLFGQKKVVECDNEPAVIHVGNEDERMNWAMEKAQLTLSYFEKSVKKPSEEQQYFSAKIKLEERGEVEHIWLTDPQFDNDNNLFGKIGNDPIHIKSLKINQEIGVDKEQISDWMIVENGCLIGGYTIRAFRDGLVQKKKDAHDKELGLIIDEGVDYFDLNTDTPEGAILLLEQAYKNKNLDAALSCKDFTEEARLMLSDFKVEITDETLSSMAETLMLSFINHIEENEFPNFDGVTSAFPKREKINDKHYIITEICRFPDGNKSIQRINVSHSNSGWKVLNVVKQNA